MTADVVASNDEPTRATEDPCAGGQVADLKIGGGGGPPAQPGSGGSLGGLGGSTPSGETGGGAPSSMNRSPRDASISVAPGRPAVTGAIAPGEITRVIAQHLNLYRFCYERELRATPGISGTVVLDFTIDPLGKVADADASGVNDALDACVVRVTKRAEFPRTHRNATTVQLSIAFRAP